MSLHYSSHRNRPIETALHPAVNLALAGTLVWLLAAVWLAFGAQGYTALQLAIATFLSVMFALVPYTLWLISQSGHKPAAAKPFRQWATHELQTASGPVDGKDAAIMVLLAPAAVSLGITVTSVIAILAARGLL
jgi:hypothetical protein